MSDIPWENGFDPVAFAEKWYEEHPEVLDQYLKVQDQMDSIRKVNSEPKRVRE